MNQTTFLDMSKPIAPRSKPRVMAHVTDADWDERCLFECKLCNFDFDGKYHDPRSVTEDRRGRPCPYCNADRSIAANMKPLFVPLMTKHYEAFLSGDKDTEFRMFGPRWNYDTCLVGRSVNLSKGYGIKNRLSGVIIEFKKRHILFLNDDVQQSLTELYGSKLEECKREIACVKIEVT